MSVMSGPNSGQFPIHAPDAPPKKREPVLRPVVRVTIPEGSSSAIVYSEDRKVDTTFPAGALAKRFYRGEARSGYFKSDLFEDGVLEIGERVPDPSPRW
jgi:hypothetical protein